MADGKLIYEVRANTDNLNDDLSKAEKSASSKLGKLGDVGKTAGKAITTTFAAVGTAAVAVGAAAINSATNLDQAMNQFSASTGIAEEDLSSYEETLKNIYTNNYGESFEDIAEKMGLVTQQIDGLDQASLQNLTEGLYTLEDTFGADFNETLRGADQLMTQFGISSEEALDLLAAGSQAGLNYTDELGDNIAEYAGKFSQAGYSAEEYFQLLANGADGGSYNLDKVNDAINEVTTKLADGSIGDAIGSFSAETQNLFEQWQNGGATQKEVIDSIVKDISTCTNEQEALTMAATAFGTMGEDANLDFIKSLTSVGDEFDNVQGKMDGLKETKYDDLGSMFESLGRTVETLLLPLGEQLIPLISDIIENVLPVIEELLPPITEAIGNMLPPIMAIIEEALPPLLELFEQIAPLFAELLENLAPVIAEFLPQLIDLLMELAPIFMDAITNLLPPLLELFLAIIEPLMGVVQQLLPPLLDLLEKLIPPITNILQAILPPLVDILMLLLEPIMDLIDMLLPPLMQLLEDLTPLFEAVMEVVEILAGILVDVLGAAFELIEPIIEAFMDILDAVIGFITDVFAGDWEGAWNNIVELFKGIFNLIPAFVELVINGVIDLINGLLSGLNWAADLIGWDLNLRISHVSLPRFHTGGIVDWEDSEGAALLQDGEMVLTQQQQAELFAIANGEEASGSRPLMADITLTGDVQMDGFKVGKVVLRNLDDVAAFTLRG